MTLNLQQPVSKELDEQSLITDGVTDRTHMKQQAIVTARSAMTDMSIPESSPHINQDYRRILLQATTTNFNHMLSHHKSVSTLQTSLSDRYKRGASDVIQSEDFEDSQLHSAHRLHAFKTMNEQYEQMNRKEDTGSTHRRCSMHLENFELDSSYLCNTEPKMHPHNDSLKETQSVTTEGTTQANVRYNVSK